jgi:poly(A) polymerase
MKTFGLKPCKEVGIIKNAIKDAILDGIIGNNFEDAYNLMLTTASEMDNHLASQSSMGEK